MLYKQVSAGLVFAEGAKELRRKKENLRETEKNSSKENQDYSQNKNGIAVSGRNILLVGKGAWQTILTSSNLE